MTMTINGTSGLVFNDASTQNTAATGFGFKNRIINGAMVIDQRNAGASVSTTGSSVYTLDRWKATYSQTTKFTVQQNAGSVTPPVGFSNYLGCTSTSAYSITSSDFFLLSQQIEGLNTADLAWGTASASPVTISFWVRSSLTGTFGGVVCNSNQDRSYPFSYTISAANTWEQKSVTIAGDTTGTWLSTSGTGLWLKFGIGVGSTYSGTAGAWSSTQYLASATGATSVVGTSGATFYITGVQLEKGSTATSFDYRPYGTELALCQRYYYRLTPSGLGNDYASGWNNSTTVAFINISFPVSMRISPSSLEQTGTASNYSTRTAGATVTNCSDVPSFYSASTNTSMLLLTVASGLTAGQGANLRPNATTAFLAWSAEL
jgi:hypothetical protein